MVPQVVDHGFVVYSEIQAQRGICEKGICEACLGSR